jgi:heat shock protein HslJ
MRILAAAAAIAMAGCAAGPVSPSQTKLTGTWRIVAFQTASQPIQLFLPAELAYQVTFSAPRVSVRVDCNTCSGSFTSGSTLVIGPGLACTRASCSSDALNNELVTLLDGSHQVSELNGRMTLRSSRGTIVLTKQ